MKTKNLAILALLTTAVIWGVTIPLMKVNLTIVPPLTIAFLRFSLAALIALSFGELNKLKLRDFFHIGFFAFFGLALSIGLLLIGLDMTTAINATILVTISPVITSIVAASVLKEKIKPMHKLGIFLAFIGVCIYLVLPELAAKNVSQVNIIGDLLVLLSVLAATVFTIGSKKLFTSYHPGSISSVSFMVASICFLPGAFFEYLQNPLWVKSVTGFNIFSIIFLGVFSSFIAYSTLEWGLSKVDVHVDVTIGYLSSIIAILIATTFLHEKLYPVTFLISAILVGIGILLVSKNKAPSLHFHHRINHHA